MRELAKLLIELTRLDSSVKNLFSALRPENYDTLVTATKRVARYDQEKEFYDSPTFAMNIGTSLKQCCDIALLFVYKKR